MTISRNLAGIRARIAAAEAAAGRPPGAVTLIAVSKTHGAEAIEEAIAAGQRHFGENRVQEAKAKWPALRARHPGVTLHGIGPLQTNKVREAVALFDAIHVLDRPRLAAALAAEMAKQGRTPQLFVEVNIGGEAAKHGVAPDEAAAFVAACRTDHGLAVAGLMAVPPADAAPAPYFARLAGLAAAIGLPSLSMGMSGDFEAAIEAGATHIRVGSAIFGTRR